MGLEQTGIEAIFKDENFQAGLKRYNQGIGQMNSSTESGVNIMNRFGSLMSGAVVAGLGAATVAIGAFTAASKIGLDATLKWGETLDKLGDMFGLDAKQADIWATALDRFGVPIEEGAQQLNFFTKGLAETIKVGKDGTATLTPFGEALKKLGISGIDPVTKKTKTFNQVMPEVLSAFSKLPAGVDASNLAMDLFGARGGSKMLDFLRDGNKSIPEITKRINELGGMTDDQVGNVEQFGRVWKDVEDIGRRFWLQIGNALLPIIKDLTEYVSKNVLPVFTKWAKENAPKITQALRDLGNWIKGTLLTILGKLATWFVTQGLPLLAKFQIFVVTQLIPAINNLSRWVNNELLPAFKDFSDWIQKEVIPELQEMWQWIKQYVLPVLGDLWEVFRDYILPRLGDFVAFLRNTVFPALGELYGWFKQNILPILSQLVDFINRYVVPAEQFMAQVFMDLVGVLATVWNSFNQLINNLNATVSSIIAAGSQIYNALVSPFQDALNWIITRDWFGAASYIFSRIQSALSSAYSWVYDKFIAPIQNALAWIIDTDWWSVGGWIFQNIANGLNAIATRVAQALQGPLQQLLDTINGILRSLGIAVGGAPALATVAVSGGASSISNFNSSSSTINNFNLTVNSSASASRITSDFGIMRALAT